MNAITNLKKSTYYCLNRERDAFGAQACSWIANPRAVWESGEATGRLG